MSHTLPALNSNDLNPTRDYLREIALVLSSLQRGFLPEQPHDWQYGLEVGMRGLLTQSFMINDGAVRASLDLHRYKVRLGSSNWRLDEYAPAELFDTIKAWLATNRQRQALDEPMFSPGVREFVTEQADKYAEALWWLHDQFRIVKARLPGGLTSPILLYPHHFDLSLVWFPHDDERQIALGWSTGDNTITEPYLYVTAYPEPANFAKITLPKPAYLQHDGFSAAVLKYNDLVSSDDPVRLFADYARVAIFVDRVL